MGLIRAESKLPDPKLKTIILRIQRELFIVGAELATDKSKRDRLIEGKTLITDEMIKNLEKDIDNLTEKNGLPNFFVVPGENIISAKLDWSRVISRRAERKCVTWYKTLDMKDSKVVIYLNRLSDLLWMMARDFEKDWTPSN
jgi:cob(I)alamin adenosyltransferase